MTWQERVYGGRKVDGDIPKPSNVSLPASQAAQDGIMFAERSAVSIVAFSSEAVDLARARLRLMHDKMGQSWYQLGRIYERPAGTIQHWANGRGMPDDATIESILKTQLFYAGLEPKVIVKRIRKPYWRPCLPATLTTEQRAQVVALAQLLEDKP